MYFVFNNKKALCRHFNFSSVSLGTQFSCFIPCVDVKSKPLGNQVDNTFQVTAASVHTIIALFPSSFLIIEANNGVPGAPFFIASSSMHSFFFIVIFYKTFLSVCNRSIYCLNRYFFYL